MADATLYFVNWSLHNQQAKELVEHSGLEVKMIDLSEPKVFSDFANDTHNSIQKLPALHIKNYGLYEGLNRIKEFLGQYKN
jgi:hypothetical protein